MKSEVKVGLVVFLAVVMFVTGLIWIKGYRFNQKFNTVTISFPDIGALAEGDFVAVSGVRAGKVKKIELISGKVHITCLIDQAIFLGQDATFTVKNIGLMGERFIAVYPGTSSVPLDLNEVREGRFDTGIPEVMGILGDMVTEIRELIRQFGSTVASPGTMRDAQETIELVHDLAANLNELVNESKVEYKQSLLAIKNASKSLDDFVQSRRPTADSAIADLASASAKLDRLADNLDTLSSSMQMFVDKLNSDDGSLGLLASDQTLYQDVKKAIREVDKLVEDIRENPKRYLKMEFKLF